MVGFKLLDERVAILADEVAETNAAGLYVLESGQELLRYGTVAAVGIGRRSEHTGELVPADVAVGDRVFFHRMSGQPLKVEDTEYIFLSPREIIGVVEE